VPQWPQNRLPAEFWWPQLAQVSTKAAPQAPQKFWSSGLSLPQLGHRTPVLVCVAVDSPFTSLPRDPYRADDKPYVRASARAAQANARDFMPSERQLNGVCDYVNAWIRRSFQPDGVLVDGWSTSIRMQTG
jgi:hypothetical protein